MSTVHPRFRLSSDWKFIGNSNTDHDFRLIVPNVRNGYVLHLQYISFGNRRGTYNYFIKKPTLKAYSYLFNHYTQLIPN